jgi:hypothetical protein
VAGCLTPCPPCSTLYKTFASPWSANPARNLDPEFSLPNCYLMSVRATLRAEMRAMLLRCCPLPSDVLQHVN